MLHNYQYKFLSISRCRYLRLIIPLCSICTFFFSLFGNKCYAAINPTASLSVSNPTLSATVVPGDTAYLSSNVTYSASDIDSYTLQVSYANGYNSLKLDGGSTTLSGAGGKVGSSLTNNSWGFAWTNNTTNNTSTNAGLTYYTVPTYGTNGSNLSMGRLESASNLTSAGNITLSSTTKRIVFAAKFAETNNNFGHYKTGVQLSMIVTPRKLIGLEKANTMQDLATHPEYCEETPYLSGQTYSDAYPLKDSRDGNTYNIRKFGDGKCWMAENLKLKLTTAGLSKDDTDLNQGADWNQSSPNTVVKPTNTLTALNTTEGKKDFSSDKGNYAVQSYQGNGTSPEVSAGATMYYSWNAATAGTGGITDTTGNYVPKGSQAPSSICPKGWKLPTGGITGNTEFYNLFNPIKNSGGVSIYENGILKTSGGTNWKSPAADSLKVVQDAPYNFKPTGKVYYGSPDGTDSGYWWSSTGGDVNYAYILFVASSHVGPATTYTPNCSGIPIRCIARN